MEKKRNDQMVRNEKEVAQLSEIDIQKKATKEKKQAIKGEEKKGILYFLISGVIKKKMVRSTKGRLT